MNSKFKCNLCWLAYWIVQRMNDINRKTMTVYDDDGIHSDDPGDTDEEKDSPTVKRARASKAGKTGKRGRSRDEPIEVDAEADEEEAAAAPKAKRPKKAAAKTRGGRSPSISPSPRDDELDEDWREEPAPKKPGKKPAASKCRPHVDDDSSDHEDDDDDSSTKGKGKKGSSAAAAAAAAAPSKRIGTKAALMDSMTSKFSSDDFVSRLNEIRGKHVGTFIELETYTSMVSLIIKANKVSTNLPANKVGAGARRGRSCACLTPCSFSTICGSFDCPQNCAWPTGNLRRRTVLHAEVLHPQRG